jgi:glycosyltransferase involved in cell wall biosynthesis
VLRVTHLISDLDTGGAELMLARLINACRSNDIEQDVISLSTSGPVGERIAKQGVAVHALGLDLRRPNPLSVFALIRVLRKLQPDVLQTWLYHADLAGIIAGRVSRVRTILWNIRCGELDPRDHAPSLTPLLRALAFASRWPAAVICNSEAGRLAHERLGYTPRRWDILPNGFDTEEFRPSGQARADLRRHLGIDERTNVIGMLARYHPMKDHETFLRSAALVARSAHEVHFVAAGRGVDAAPAVHEMVCQLDLVGRVTLWPESGDPSGFLSGLDVAVSSSYSEAFPNVVGEAMACETPCVATDVGESAAIVGEAGAIVPPADPPALAEAICRLLELDRTARASLGRAARRRIETEFSLEQAASRYVQLYRQLASRATRAPDVPICAG